MVDGLTVAELVLACLIVVTLVPILGLVARRRWLASRGWVFECSLRMADTTPSSWMLGVVRLNGEDLEWYRVFSASLRPRVVLRRGSTHVRTTRFLYPDERALLVEQERVAVLEGGGRTVELAMSPTRETALLSWLEAAPPGLGYR